MLRSSSVLFLSLALVACGGDDTTADSGTPGSDAGTDGGLQLDSGPRPDSGGPADDCATDDATATVGCNGYITSEPAANAAFGTCEPGTDAAPAGSCTAAATICFAGENATSGWCHQGCSPADTYVSTGECPTGTRCFTIDTDFALCFRDCDATHPCPSGMACDGENSCIPEDVAASPDGGTPAGDAGTELPDASIDVDAGLPDADLPDADLPDAGIAG